MEDFNTPLNLGEKTIVYLCIGITFLLVFIKICSEEPSKQIDTEFEIKKNVHSTKHEFNSFFNINGGSYKNSVVSNALNSIMPKRKNIPVTIYPNSQCLAARDENKKQVA